MKTTMRKSVKIWFFLSFVAILALDVDNSSIGAVLAVLGNFVAAGGLVIQKQNKERREGLK